MLPRFQLAALLLLVLPVFARAAEVLKTDRHQRTMAVTHTRERRWKTGDYLCVVRRMKEVACGPTIKATSRGAIVRFDYHSGATVLPGDPVEFYLYPPEHLREPPSESKPESVPAENATSAPEKEQKEARHAEPPTPSAEPSPTPQPNTATEDWVDLDALDSAPAPTPKPEAKNVAQGGSSPHGRLGTKPKFRMLFDWLLAYRSFTKPHVTFDKYHTLLMFEIRPQPRLYFGFEVSPSPRYYEVSYDLSRTFTLRAGKIAMPFDDLSPHSYFGGRINISRLTPAGSSAFLPDFWSDLGVAMRWRIAYSKSFEWTLHFAITNGFGSGAGQNPMDPTRLYPEFAQTNGAQDNNRDKAFTLRTSMGFMGDKFAVGASVYRGRYSDQADPTAFVHMVGLDAQARVGRAELRGGYVFMLVDTPGDVTESYRRGGAYGEFGVYLDRRDKFRWSLRGGAVQHDSRVVANSDQILVGSQFSYRAGPVVIAYEYDLDVHTFSGKPQNYMTGVRLTLGL